MKQKEQLAELLGFLFLQFCDVEHYNMNKINTNQNIDHLFVLRKKAQITRDWYLVNFANEDNGNAFLHFTEETNGSALAKSRKNCKLAVIR